MKTVSLQELEANFDFILADVIDNKSQYKIIDDDGKAVMLVPYEEYEVLYDVYKDWVVKSKDNLEESF